MIQEKQREVPLRGSPLSSGGGTSQRIPTISGAALIPGIQSRLRDWAFLDPSCGTKPPVDEGSGKREAHGEVDLILVSSSYSED